MTTFSREFTKVYDYQALFNKVLNKRLRFVLNINLILSFILALVYEFMPMANSNSDTNHSIWQSIPVLICVKVPTIFFTLSVIRQVRKQFLIVEYSHHKTLGAQIYYSILSFQFLINWLGYLISSWLIFGAVIVFTSKLKFNLSDYYILSKEYRQHPIINDQWVYYWYNPVFISFFYTCNQLIFQRQRLNFEIGNIRNKPQNYLFKHLPILLGNSLGLNLFVISLTPITYWLVKYYIYKSFILIILIFRLDSDIIPNNNTSWITYLQLSYLSFFIILSWEVVNHVFNVYATIGCLDGNKPISSYSTDPLNCLLSGLRDVDPNYQLSRLTAFQELAYLATSSDKEALKLRFKIFSFRSKKLNAWTSLLEECALVIKETTDRINYRSTSDLNALKSLEISGLKGNINNYRDSKQNSDNLFGNSFINTSPVDKKSSELIKKYQANTSTTAEGKKKSNKVQELIGSIQHFASQFFGNFQKTIGDANQLQEKFAKSFNFKHYLQIYQNYKDKFLQTYIGIFFRITMKRDNESRIINPINFCNSIIAISNLLQYSIEEDKYDIISNDDVCKVLNLLEKPIRATTNYIDYLPASVYVPQNSQPKKHSCLMGKLHDLSMHEFYEICIRFNGKLNDLILTPRTYKLVKWVIDKEIAIQQEIQKQKHQKLNLK
ncbi:nucleoporin NDC1 [Candida albicans P57072]|nr:nucleoporin NDC1 [Candida albicans P57072]KHC31978.1 nucleoporin NDC1 [Candida albicans P76055]